MVDKMLSPAFAISDGMLLEKNALTEAWTTVLKNPHRIIFIRHMR